MLFQTEKLSSFHCCKLWFLLYFFVNIESIASLIECRSIRETADVIASCTKGDSLGSECTYECTKIGHYYLTSDITSLCMYDYDSMKARWSPQSPPECAKAPPKNQGCNEDTRIELVFVLDGSGSIDPDSFKHMLTWTTTVGDLLIETFKLHLKINVIQYSSTVQVEAASLHITSPGKFERALEKITQLGDWTHTVDAMNKALEILNDDKPKCPDNHYQKIMILLTDGHNTQTREGLVAEAKLLEDAGVESYVVGVEDANYEELLIIAYGQKDKVFNVDNFDFLHENVYTVASRVASTLGMKMRVHCEWSKTYLENGDASCTYENYLGSKCTYTCDAGYTLSNPHSLTAHCKYIHYGARWSAPPPRCIPDCKDKKGNCSKLVSQGICKHNESYMVKNCRKACGFCH